jgi:hypothetical protein
MPIFDDGLDPPARTQGDILHKATEAALPLLPIVGLLPGAPQLFQAIIGPPFERRLADWCHTVSGKLRELGANRGFKPEDLSENPGFVDVIMTATQAALRTSQKEKQDALRNAVANAALPGAPELAAQQLFIGLVDRLTDWHLVILKVFQNPVAWRAADGRHLRETSSMMAVIFQAFPELKGRDELVNLVWADLKAAGLHRSGDLNTMMTGAGSMAKRTTEFGDQFLAFISAPVQ